MVGAENRLFVERPDRLLRDRVTDVVREAILRGDLEAGRRLTERELGELTGVSRTSLREALRSLQAEGLVERSEARGVRVALLNEAVVGELYDVRAPLEATAVELCTEKISDDQVMRLRSLILPLDVDLDVRLDSLRHYYSLLLEVAGNSVLAQVFSSIEARIHALRRISLRIEGRAESSRAELLEVVKFMERRDTTAAGVAARAHVVAAKEAALAALRTRVPREESAYSGHADSLA